MPEPECETLKRPKMSGLLMAQAKRNLITALTLTAIAGTAYRFLYYRRKKRRYREYWE